MRLLIGLLAISFLTAPAWGEELLYQPRLLAPGEQPAPDGVLVRVVMVKKGDTLSHLARRYAGRGSYYPQILLFNRIRNPRLIYPGERLRVPVMARHRRRTTAAAKRRHGGARPAPAVQGDVTPPRQADPEQAGYAAALASLKRGDCSEAVAQFDRFIERYPQSPLLAEATLHRADCYLKLSAR